MSSSNIESFPQYDLALMVCAIFDLIFPFGNDNKACTSKTFHISIEAFFIDKIPRYGNAAAFNLFTFKRHNSIESKIVD